MDINDYKDWGIIGLDQRAPNEIDWRGPYISFRDTRVSHFKALNEYFESSMVVTKIEDRQTLLDAYNVFFEKGRLFKPVASQFWNSLVSLPVTFNVGDVFDIGEDPQVVGQQLYPMPFNNGEEVQQFAYLSEGGEYIYTIYTEELHNEYISALGEVMLAEKQLFILIDGDTFEDYVAPTTTTTTTEATSTTTTTEAPTTTTTTTEAPIITFTKANYGTDVDVVSQYLTLKRGNDQGLFNTNEGTVYEDKTGTSGTWFGGKNHLWCVANNGGHTFNTYVDLWNTFDTSTINIAQLQSDYEDGNDVFIDKSMVPWGVVHGGNPPGMLNKEMIMLDVLDGKFYKVKFTQWSSNGSGGGLSYTRELFN